jgi:hypothetical protein
MRTGLMWILSIGFVLAIAAYVDPALAQRQPPTRAPAPLIGGGAVAVGLVIAAVWLARRFSRRD